MIDIQEIFMIVGMLLVGASLAGFTIVALFIFWSKK